MSAGRSQRDTAFGYWAVDRPAQAAASEETDVEGATVSNPASHRPFHLSTYTLLVEMRL